MTKNGQLHDKGQGIFLTPLNMLTSLFSSTCRGPFESQKNYGYYGSHVQIEMAFLGGGPLLAGKRNSPCALSLGRLRAAPAASRGGGARRAGGAWAEPCKSGSHAWLTRRRELKALCPLIRLSLGPCPVDVA